MVNILLSGALGRMGCAVTSSCAASGSCRIIAGIDINAAAGALGCTYPVYEKLSDFTGKADVIVDFSNHTAISSLLEYAVKERTPVVAATTGYTADELEVISKASKSIPVFRSGNMSLGINLLIELAKKASAVLGTAFDVEIVETHHRNKLDAPSGTALMIADALSETLGSEADYVFDRSTERRERRSGEIGIHSVRGGSVVGDHQVMFLGDTETITLSHSASSRSVFADGALKSAEFICGKPAGLYDMSDLINSASR